MNYLLKMGFNKMDIKSLNRDELVDLLKKSGQPSYRADQILEWLYKRLATDFIQMTNLPIRLREDLSKQFSVCAFKLIKVQGATDSTQKFLWQLSDGSYVESVLVPATPALYGEPSDRKTICISTQVGCAYRCRFCASGLYGLKRDLNAEEIVEQVLSVERFYRAHNSVETPPIEYTNKEISPAQIPLSKQRIINNIVVMGMGEPLANYSNVLKAIKILNAPWGFNIGARKITISTCGLVPEIIRLASEPIQIRLAISLHGATDEVRSKIMPINKKYPLDELIRACAYYQKNKKGKITFEYILIKDVNDSAEQARKLAELALKLNAKVNLIPYNRVEGLKWDAPAEDVQAMFLNILKRRGIQASLRVEKGSDIDAACGQLRLKTEQSLHKN